MSQSLRGVGSEIGDECGLGKWNVVEMGRRRNGKKEKWSKPRSKIESWTSKWFEEQYRSGVFQESSTVNSVFLVIFECYGKSTQIRLNIKEAFRTRLAECGTRTPRRSVCVSQCPLPAFRSDPGEAGRSIHFLFVSYSWIRTIWCCVIIKKNLKDIRVNPS